ncbi:MAG: TonB-dependent receptor plug domain-containing protein, partial [Sphingopyxis sp.]
MENRGLTNVADALNELPGFGTPASPAGAQNAFGAGANFVNLYGLGTQRTLTLLNGRRVVSANAASSFSGGNPGVQVDLNIITTQLVNRVESISVGGAPTYGSDAIAGTTNVIFKRDFEGLEVQLTNGITDRGDGRRYNVSAAFGHNFAGGRGNITLSGSIDRQDGVFAIDRPFFREAFAFAANPTEAQAATIPGRTPANDGRVDPNIPFQLTAAATPDGIPNNVLLRNSRVALSNDNGVLFPSTGATTMSGSRLRGFGPSLTNYLQFAPGGNIVTYDPGIPFGSTFSGGQGNFPAENQQITSDLDRRAFTALARYSITDDVDVFFEGIYYSAEARELGDSGNVNGGFLTTGESGMLTIRNDYPLLSQQARNTLAANGITSFRLSRNLDDLFRQATSSESEMIRGVAGLEGEFELGGRNFNWEATANFG